MIKGYGKSLIKPEEDIDIPMNKVLKIMSDEILQAKLDIMLYGISHNDALDYHTKLVIAKIRSWRNERMKKEWCLNQYKKSMYNQFLDGQGDRIWTPEDYFYLEEDIHNLRKELIEDIKKFYAEEEPSTFTNYEEYFMYRGQRIIDEIINRRFGIGEQVR